MEHRKQSVLEAVVCEYITCAEPVASGTIWRRYNLGFSPATIRNEMAELEKEGYLKQPHTSAGRIPSDLGYRFYVDYLMHPRVLTPKEQQIIQRAYPGSWPSADIEEILQQILKILSTLFDYMVVVTLPKLRQSVIKAVQLILLNVQEALLVLLTTVKLTDNLLIELPQKVDQEELNKISCLLTQKLQGKTLGDLDQRLTREVASEIPSHRELLRETLEVIEKTVALEGQERVLVGGTSHILRQPEFRNINRMYPLLAFLEDEESLSKVVEEITSRVTVKIGEENKYKEMQECSLAGIPYYMEDKILGKVGIIGPTRLEYDRVTSALDRIAEALTSHLNSF